MPAGDLIANLERAGEEYARFVESLPADRFHHRPEPEAWTVAEITGHVAEFPATFAGTLLQLFRTPGMQVGRAENDEGRLAALARLRGAGPAEAGRAVRAAVGQAVASLRSIAPEGWDVRGRHPRLGEATVAQLAGAVILDHLRGHLEQARATADAALPREGGDSHRPVP